MLFCCNLETWGAVLLFDNTNSHDIGNPKTLNLEDNLSLKLVYISLRNNDGLGVGVNAIKLTLKTLNLESLFYSAMSLTHSRNLRNNL
jgi:hypothetical protein